ncbi:Sensor histidine kinase CusS [Paraburkholderia kirstenboschensis]|nr:Sensor histidine kinase CusS [Paraburkholderia kirstenboschensis]
MTRTGINVADVIADELDEVRAVHPDRQLDLHVNGDLHGAWDAHRVQQIVQNLVLNAIKYGARDTPVRVEVTGDSTHVRIDVRNRGRAIEPVTLACMFNPLARVPSQQQASHKEESLGLGLYIANEIAKAHHGSIEARSDETETSFSVSLPRQ